MNEISVSVPGLDRLLAGLHATPHNIQMATEKSMAQATLVAEAEIKARTPRRTGRLFSAWQGTVIPGPGSVTGIIGNPVSYGPYVEEGTAPHDILPVNAGALRFTIGGKVVFAKRVHHPGTKGKHMAREGLLTATPDILALFSLGNLEALLKVKGV